jgi:hypothetical protein
VLSATDRAGFSRSSLWSSKPKLTLLDFVAVYLSSSFNTTAISNPSRNRASNSLCPSKTTVPSISLQRQKLEAVSWAVYQWGLADGEDGVLSQVCYDWTTVVGLVRAAERFRSPVILQLFPVTLKYGGGEFLRLCIDL